MEILVAERVGFVFGIPGTTELPETFESKPPPKPGDPLAIEANLFKYHTACYCGE